MKFDSLEGKIKDNMAMTKESSNNSANSLNQSSMLSKLREQTDEEF